MSDLELAAPGDLAADTEVVPVDKVPGRYVVHLPPSWDFFYPSGGVLLTVALRAMRAELGATELFPLSATAVFCAPVPAGDLVVHVDVLRRGAGAAQLRASVRAAASPENGLEVLATFVGERPGPDVTGVRMPDVPGPASAVPVGDRPGERARFPFYRNFDCAQAIGRPDERGGEAHAAFWWRYRVPQTTADGRFDALAFPPILDTIPPALWRALPHDAPRMIAPSLDITVHLVAPSRASWHLVEQRCERARGGIATGSANVWSEDGALVARATQIMTLRPYRP